MAFTQSDVDELRRAIATGAMRVRYADGREVQYRTLAEMRETLTMMTDEVVGSTGGSSRGFLASF